MRGAMKDLCEKHIADAGNVTEGVVRFRKEVVEFMGDPKFNTHNFSVREAFDQTVLRENPNLDINASTVDIAEAVGHSQFPYMTKELISKELIAKYELTLNGIDQLVTESTTNKFPYEFVAGMRAMSQMPLVKPGQNFPDADWAEKYVRIQIAKFGEILNLEKELVLSDQTGEILLRAAKGGEMMGQHRERFIIDTIIDAPRQALEESTSTAFHYKGTRYAIYSTDHSAIDGYTNANYLSSGGGIATADSVNTALGYLAAQKDEKGNYVSVRPAVILVHPTNYQAAWHLCTDTGMKELDSANRGANYYQSLGLRPYQSAFTTDTGSMDTATTTWYIGDPRQQTRWLWFQKPEVLRQGVDSDAAFERDVIARFRYDYTGGCGLTDYKFMVCMAVS